MFSSHGVGEIASEGVDVMCVLLVYLTPDDAWPVSPPCLIKQRTSPEMDQYFIIVMDIFLFRESTLDCILCIGMNGPGYGV